MFHAMTYHDLVRHQILQASMLRDRAKQFVSRHQWRLNVDSKGFELDEYDDEFTTYCIVEAEGRHAASLRLRPETEGSMVEAHFHGLWAARGSQLRRSVEVTRFCAGTNMGPQARDIAISDLLLGLCEHCIDNGIPSFFGVVFPSVARVLIRLGWAPEVLASSLQDDRTLLLAKWEANIFTMFDLQSARARRRISATVEAVVPEAA